MHAPHDTKSLVSPKTNQHPSGGCPPTAQCQKLRPASRRQQSSREDGLIPWQQVPQLVDHSWLPCLSAAVGLMSASLLLGDVGTRPAIVLPQVNEEVLHLLGSPSCSMAGFGSSRLLYGQNLQTWPLLQVESARWQPSCLMTGQADADVTLPSTVSLMSSCLTLDQCDAA